MIAETDILNITSNYDFKKNCMNSIEKLTIKIDKNPELVEDIIDFNVCDLYYIDKKGEEIKNFLRYKLINDIYKGPLVDCDNMMLTKKILATILDNQKVIINKVNLKDNNSRIFIIENSVELETDTMNSFWTIFNIFLNKYICPELDSKCIKYYGKKNATLKRYWLLKNIDEILSTDNIDEIESDFPGIVDCITEFKKFALLTHSIGNFTLVPEGYNMRRYSITNDCWDLSLIDLQSRCNEYTWYCNNIHIFLYDDYFNNYDKGKQFNDLNVKPLYHNHSFENKLPKDVFEFFQYLQNINKCIIHRGEKIINRYL